MKGSLVLCYASCLVKPPQVPRLPSRLKDLIKLIPDTADVITDIGTDHGLLAFHVAKRRPQAKVIGIDASTAALEQGAYSLAQLPNLEFRLGNGLEGLQPQDHPDTVCIAGIGTNTMTNILCPNKLLALDCQNIVLQPTRSRPRLLVQLYNHLSLAQWSLEAESILYISRRWYLTSRWNRTANDGAIRVGNQTSTLPGRLLHTPDDDIAQRWKLHHCKWILSDWKVGGSPPSESEQQWMEQCCCDS
jgi:tRNA A22 N-methylase